MIRNELTLAIETALEGGSISLLHGVAEIDCWIGKGEISKSEDVLEQIERILERNNLEKKRIKKIVVSRGPGSYTGVRIGMAIAYGLRKALKCDLSSVSVWDGMLQAAKKKTVGGEEIIIALPAGRNQVCWQIFNEFRPRENTQPLPAQFSTIDGFFSFCRQAKISIEKKIILHQKLYYDLKKIEGDGLADRYILINTGENIAALIGTTEESADEYKSLRPIYSRDNILLNRLTDATD
jgi:tRNA threonylcarbamoyl adenosine modification protein YeaZ